MKKKRSNKSEKVSDRAQLRLATEYAESLGFDVNLRGEASDVGWVQEYPHNEPYLINIETASAKRQLYDLMHELGHDRLRKRYRTYQRTYPRQDKIDRTILTGNPTKRAVSALYTHHLYQVEQIREECEAWRIGLQIARSLKITIDEGRYWKHADKCIQTYIQAANAV